VASITILVDTNAGGGGAVDSVNGQTGTVVLTNTDVGAAATVHTHEGTAILSTGQATGKVLTSDGSNGAAWQTAGGGVVNFDDNAYTSSPNNTTNVSALEAKGSTTNVDFVLKPKGNGAIIAHVPDGTATGGNKRGIGAVDFQMTRATAAQVASGQYSTIGGGYNNTASGLRSTIGGGSSNAASGSDAAIGGGESNTASRLRSTIGGGYNNTASGNYAAIGGGASNTASGLRSTIGGGASNAASGDDAAIGGGESNTASGQYSAVIGGANNTTNAQGYATVGGRYGKALNSSDFVVGYDGGGGTGVAQSRQSQKFATTANATPLAMATLECQLTSTIPFRGYVVCRSNSATNESAVFAVDGVLRYGATVDTGVLDVSNVTVVHRTTGTIAVSMAAATSAAAGLIITCTGLAATSMRWLADIHFTDLVY